MYQFSFDENTTKRLQDTTKVGGEIFEKFNQIDKKYNSLNGSETNLNLKEISFEKPTEEDVKQKAENNLFDYKNTNINSINEKYDNKIESIEEQKGKIDNNKQESLIGLENKYAKVKEEAKNDAIKRGLARSSIIVNTLSGLDRGMMQDLKELETKANDKISALNEQKSLLEQQKQNALNSFDITYAVKLQNEIDSINSNILKNEQEAIKYNNEIAKLQAKWEKEQEDGNFDKTSNLVGLIGKYGTAVFDVLKQNEKYAVASEYFAQLNKEDAILELQNNPKYKENLGTSGYNKLVKEIKNR